jgi:hypothetical protein
MATKAEEFRSREQKKGKPSKVSAKKPRKAKWSRAKSHAASKATHAFEPTAPGKRPSRESSRSSANRAKADSGFDLTEELKKGKPENRALKARAKRTRVRGATAR